MKSVYERQQSDKISWFSISVRLVTVIIIIVGVSFAAITVLMHVFIRPDFQKRGEAAHFEVEYVFSHIRSDSRALIQTINAAGLESALARQAAEFFFKENRNIAALRFTVSGQQYPLVLNPWFSGSPKPDEASAGDWFESHDAEMRKAAGDETIILNAAPHFATPLLAMFFPLPHGSGGILFSPPESLSQSYLIDSEENIFMNADPKIIPAHNTILEQWNAAIGLIIPLVTAVIFMVVLGVWFFSRSISVPIKAPAMAARSIEGGNIKPGGLSKYATVFFSDIRGFTEKSENFTKEFGDEASDRIVHWLNDYFTPMVDCVEKTGGVVDKFIGDAVMAHWGAASTSGNPGLDAYNCIRAALMMRVMLYRMNKSRTENDPGNPPIRIGCGINTGWVTAGQIGSGRRMEYTVIGDPVNLASRAEALNKSWGTDIIITEDTWNLVKKHIIAAEIPKPVMVKGKPVRLFAVINLAANPTGPRTMADLRKILGIKGVNAAERKYTTDGVK